MYLMQPFKKVERSWSIFIQELRKNIAMMYILIKFGPYKAQHILDLFYSNIALFMHD